MNTINSSQNAMFIFQGERGESAVRFINSTLEFDDGKYACSIIKQCEVKWQLNHEVPKIKFCDGTFYTGGILNGLFHGNGTLTLPNGDTLTAMFNHNTVESNGVFTNQFGTYSGEFYPEMVVSAGYDFSKKDLTTFFHGKGTFTNIHGIEKSGTWNRGQLRP